MASVALTQEDIKTLEQTRQRLLHLGNNIAALQQEVLRGTPLPEWSSIQNRTSILAQNIQSVTAHLSRHSDLLDRTVVYPSTNYPGRTQEHILLQLLQKKLEPAVETLVDEGRSIGQQEGGARGQDEELWSWASGWINERVMNYALHEAGKNYTVEERKMGIDKVNTGLRRKLEDDESSEDEADDDDDDDDDEDEEMEDAGVKVTTARRTSTGQVEFGMGEVKKDSGGKSRTVKDILALATSGTINNSNGAGPR